MIGAWGVLPWKARLQAHGNVQRFRGGLVFKAHRLVYHSTLGVRVIKKKKHGLVNYSSPGVGVEKERRGEHRARGWGAVACERVRQGIKGVPYSQETASS